MAGWSPGNSAGVPMGVLGVLVTVPGVLVGSCGGPGGGLGVLMAVPWSPWWSQSIVAVPGGPGGDSRGAMPTLTPIPACRVPCSSGGTSRRCGSWCARSAPGWLPRPGRRCRPSASSGTRTQPCGASCSSQGGWGGPPGAGAASGAAVRAGWGGNGVGWDETGRGWDRMGMRWEWDGVG